MQAHHCRPHFTIKKINIYNGLRYHSELLRTALRFHPTAMHQNPLHSNSEYAFSIPNNLNKLG